MAESNIKYADMKHIFLLWKIQTEQKIEKKKCHALANKVYQLSTYNETWQVWNQHKRQKKRLKLMKRQAKAIHMFSTLKQNMEAWRKQYEHVRTCRVKSKQLEVLRQNKLLTFYFDAWKNFSSDQYQRKTIITKLEKINRNICYRKVLTRWKSVLAKSRLLEALVQKALELKRKFLLNAWYREFNLIKYKYRKMNELMKIRHFNLCRACFEQWKAYLIIQIQENLKIRKLSTQLKKINTRRYFALWRHREQTKQLKKQAQARKQEEVSKICVKQLFEIWRGKHHLSKVLKNKVQQINFIFSNLVQIKYLNIWMNYSKQRLRRQNTEIKVKIYVRKLEVRIYLSYWRQQLMLEHENRQKTTKALIHWSSKLTKKTFIAWVKYSQKKTQKMTRYKQAMELHKSFILKQGLRTLLMRGVEEIVWRNEEAKENAHLNEKILYRYFTQWRRKVNFSESLVHMKENYLELPLNQQLTDNTITQSMRGGNQKNLQGSVRFANTLRNEPKIPGFLQVREYC